MDSFYAVLYIKTNNLTDEHIAVALLTSGSEGPRLYLSEKRLRLLSDIMHRNSFLSIRRHLKAFQLQVDKYRDANKGLLLFDPVYTEQELNRLSRFSKKTIRYSTPVSVNAWMDLNTHQQIVLQMLGEKPVKIKAVKKSFYHRWRAHCNGNRYIEFRRNILSSKVKRKTEAPVKLDLYSKDKKMIVKGLDFDTSSKNVLLRLNDLLIIGDEFPDYKLYCIYPTTRKKIGKELLNDAKERLSLKIEFMNYTEFDQLKL